MPDIESDSKMEQVFKGLNHICSYGNQTWGQIHL